jgi:homoserine/homoserine lactone efflux protein
MTTSTLILFVVSSIALAITPGPTMLLALSNGVNSGIRVAAYGIAGASVASVGLISAVAVGLGALLLASEAWFEGLRVLGVLYLCWLGIKLWNSQPGSKTGMPQPLKSSVLTPRQAFVRCASVALSNPKTILFFSAFLPQFIAPDQSQASQYLILGTTFIGLDALVMLAYAAAGTRAVEFLSERGYRIVNRFCSIMMFGLAAMLVVFRRAGP